MLRVEEIVDKSSMIFNKLEHQYRYLHPMQRDTFMSSTVKCRGLHRVLFEFIMKNNGLKDFE